MYNMILKLFTRKKLKPINNFNINAFYKTTVFILLYRDIFETNLVPGLQKQFRRVYLLYIFKLPYT